MKKLTTAEFIEQAKKVHGDRYDYSKVVYKKSKEKVTIICPEHGAFRQAPNTHLCGGGCAKCAGRVKLTTPELIDKARKVHGDRYDYSKVEYNKSSVEVTIICPDHGAFRQTPNTHLSGRGCSACGRLRQILFLKHTTDKFISAAREQYGGRYDYSNVDYRGNSTAVKIICPTHGEFEQRPDKHLAKSAIGCPACAREHIGSIRSDTKESFISKARVSHGDRYDYSSVDYIDSKTKVKITCPEHGEYEQPPNRHISGAGCPSCSGNKPLSTDEYIKKAREVHGDKYDYSKTEYMGLSGFPNGILNHFTLMQ